jgi:hypothetical protein
MTEQELLTIEERASKASPGPWTHGLEMEPPDPGIEAAGGGCVAFVQVHGNINTVVRTGEEFSHDDARFIAHAREDIPALIAEIRRLKREKLLNGPQFGATWAT